MVIQLIVLASCPDCRRASVLYILVSKPTTQPPTAEEKTSRSRPIMASISQMFLCNTCSLTFASSELQRSHMHSPWQYEGPSDIWKQGLTAGSVSNLRRRVVGLPAESWDGYDIAHPAPRLTEECKKRVSSSPTPQIGSESETDSELPPSTQCLFCPQTCTSLDSNLSHMSTAHGLFIPSSCDIPSFLEDLSGIVFEDTECIYCGVCKGTVEGVQTHMRDKGHCKVPEEEAEVHIAGTKVSDREMRLANGTIAIDQASYTTRALEVRGIASMETNSAPSLRPQKPSKIHTRRVLRSAAKWVSWVFPPSSAVR
jgi:hypothetical protein